MSMRIGALLVVVVTSSACDAVYTASGGDTRQPPQAIVADGEPYFACGSDSLYIANEGDEPTTFRLKFTDETGHSHLIKGIRKLHVTQLDQRSAPCRTTGASSER